jgi:hypothetical protein
MSVGTVKPKAESLNVNFDHRLCAMDSITHGGLVDSICLMAERASGVLYILSGQFSSEENTKYNLITHKAQPKLQRCLY